MVSHNLPCSTVTNQITLDHRDSNMISEFERMMDCGCQALVSKLETLGMDHYFFIGGGGGYHFWDLQTIFF